MSGHESIHRTNSFDAADTAHHHSSSPTAASTPSPAQKLKRPSSTGDVYAIQASAAQVEQVYKPEEHKKEVRLGLRHRDSFAVHRVHLKGGPQHATGGPGGAGSPNKADMLAAWNKSPGPLPPGSKKRSISGKSAGGSPSGSRRGSGDEEGGSDEEDDGGSAPTALLTEEDLAELEAESANEEGGDDDGSSRGSDGPPSPGSSVGGAGSAPGSPGGTSPGRKSNPFRSVAKGVSSFLGLRKGRRQRMAEEAILAMATRPDETRVFGVSRGSFVNYPGQKKGTGAKALAALVPKAPAANARKTASSPFALSKASRAAPLFHLRQDGTLWEGKAAAAGKGGKKLAKLPPKPASSTSTPTAAPPPPAPKPQQPSPTPVADAVAADAGTTASGRPLSARQPPPAPAGSPAAARQAAASVVPPSPPPRPGGPSAMPASPASPEPSSASSASAPSTPVSSPPPPPPPPLTSASPRVPPAPTTPNSPGNNGRVPDPISTNHHMDKSSVPGILKTASGHTPRGNTALREKDPTSSARRRIVFADSKGGKLENVKFCDDLHYSENADHSESDWEEGGMDGGGMGGDQGQVDRSNCVIM